MDAETLFGLMPAFLVTGALALVIRGQSKRYQRKALQLLPCLFGFIYVIVPWLWPGLTETLAQGMVNFMLFLLGPFAVVFRSF